LYSCTWCEKRFSSQTGLYEHMNIHRGKYKCTECGRCCQHTDEVIQERNRLNVLFVANDLQRLETSLSTAEFTFHSGEKPYKYDVCDKAFSHSEALNTHMRVHTERNHTSVYFVTNVSANPTSCGDKNLYIATEDHITVLTVGSCLRQTLN